MRSNWAAHEKALPVSVARSSLPMLETSTATSCACPTELARAGQIGLAAIKPILFYSRLSNRVYSGGVAINGARRA